MKETSGEFGEIIERVEKAFQEYREAKKAHDDWLAEWRRRNDIPQRGWEPNNAAKGGQWVSSEWPPQMEGVGA